MPNLTILFPYHYTALPVSVVPIVMTITIAIAIAVQSVQQKLLLAN